MTYLQYITNLVLHSAEHSQVYMLSQDVTQPMGYQEMERRPTLELAKNKRFCDAIKGLGETTVICTGHIDKCEEAICNIYGYKIYYVKGLDNRC